MCRIAWGEVKKIGNGKLAVKYQPFVLNPKPHLGRAIKKEVDYEPDFLGKIIKGDWVSFHWNWACEKLNKQDIKNLKKYTELNLKYAKSR
jgi:hydrogenase maturation factor